MAEATKPNYSVVWASGGSVETLTNTTLSQGWTISKPSFQRANAVENRQDQMLKHIDQHGIPVWGSDTEYFANRSWVTGSNGELYRAVADSVGVNPVGDTSNKWYRVLDEFFTKTQSDARYLSLAVPSGAVFHFAMQTAPSGYLVCNGAAVSRTAFASLFAAVGTLYGTGDGSTTFNLPDLRGEFIRGADIGRGVDSGRAFGSVQVDELRSHLHSLKTGTNTVGTDMAFKDDSLWISGTTANDIAVDQNGVSKPVSTFNAGGTETRPRNIALLPCIKV